jgi:hypothetical protein
VSPFHELKKRQNHNALDKTMHQTDRYDLRLNKTVGMFLVCLTLWNSVLGASGGLLMCLHVAGELHLIQAEPKENCCHPSNAESLEECADCEDIKLEGFDMFALRDSQPLLPISVMVETCEVLQFEPVLCSTKIVGLRSPRGPPVSIDTCLLVAEVVELRI